MLLTIQVTWIRNMLLWRSWVPCCWKFLCRGQIWLKHRTYRWDSCLGWELGWMFTKAPFNFKILLCDYFRYWRWLWRSDNTMCTESLLSKGWVNSCLQFPLLTDQKEMAFGCNSGNVRGEETWTVRVCHKKIIAGDL